jgi:hypothetical protein
VAQVRERARWECLEATPAAAARAGRAPKQPEPPALYGLRKVWRASPRFDRF